MVWEKVQAKDQEDLYYTCPWKGRSLEPAPACWISRSNWIAQGCKLTVTYEYKDPQKSCLVFKDVRFGSLRKMQYPGYPKAPFKNQMDVFGMNFQTRNYKCLDEER